MTLRDSQSKKSHARTFNAYPQLIVIVGPTASGKSAFGVRLAKKIGGEIISADSRQVYKGLNLASGKITKKEMAGVKHHCLDLVSPKTAFTALNYKKHAQRAIKNIQNRGKTPIIVGGTGFYIDAVLERVSIPEVPPNPKLRKKLEKKTAAALFKILKKLDPARAKTVEPQNKRRLIRAIEIAKDSIKEKRSNIPIYRYIDEKILWLGLNPGKEELKKKINARIDKTFNGMKREVKNLHKNGVSWNKLENLGLWPGLAAKYLQRKLSREETLKRLKTDTYRYSQKQMTWFKRNKEINWVVTLKEAKKMATRYLTSRQIFD